MKKLITFILSFTFAFYLIGCSQKAASIGIIGGADGPTAIYVTSNTNWLTIGGLVATIVAVIWIVFTIYRRKK